MTNLKPIVKHRDFLKENALRFNFVPKRKDLGRKQQGLELRQMNAVHES